MQSRWDGPWVPPFRQDANPNVRVGDAERNQMSEILSKHYSDGRLDAAEFQERLDRAMSAKTRADLSGLLADLPPLVDPNNQKPLPQSRPRRRHPLLRVVLFVVLVAWALAFVGAGVHLWWIHIPWLLVFLVVAVIWGRERHRRTY